MARTRTLIDIDTSQLAKLDRLATRRHRSRAALIRSAVAEYLARETSEDQAVFFGLWADQHGDGVELQRALRSEW